MSQPTTTEHDGHEAAPAVDPEHDHGHLVMVRRAAIEVCRAHHAASGPGDVERLAAAHRVMLGLLGAEGLDPEVTVDGPEGLALPLGPAPVIVTPSAAVVAAGEAMAAERVSGRGAP